MIAWALATLLGVFLAMLAGVAFLWSSARRWKGTALQLDLELRAAHWTGEQWRLHAAALQRVLRTPPAMPLEDFDLEIEPVSAGRVTSIQEIPQ